MPNPHGQPQEILAPTQWKPGQSGNPHGRPRKRPQSEANEDLLRMELPEEFRKRINLMKDPITGKERAIELLPKGATFADAIALGLGKKAMAGDPACAKELRESVEGKSMQRIELTSAADRGFEVVVSYEKAPAPKAVKEAVEDKVIEAAVVTAITQKDE